MGVALVSAQQRGKAFLAFCAEDRIYLRRIEKIYVKKSNFGDFKWLVVQIDSITHCVGRFCSRCRRSCRLHNSLVKWVAVQLFRINHFAAHNAVFSEGFPNGDGVNIVEIAVFHLSIEFVILDELCHGGLRRLFSGRVMKYSCSIRAKLRFVGIEGGFGLMINGAQRVDAALIAALLCCSNRDIVPVAQFLHILLQAVRRDTAHGYTPHLRDIPGSEVQIQK